MTDVRLPGFMQLFDDDGNVTATSFAYLYVAFTGADTTISYDVVDTSGNLPEVELTSGEFFGAIWTGSGLNVNLADTSFSSFIDLRNLDGELSQIAVFEQDTAFGYLQASFFIAGFDPGDIIDIIDADAFFENIDEFGPVQTPGFREGEAIDLVNLPLSYVLSEGTPGETLSGGVSSPLVGTDNDDELMIGPQVGGQGDGQASGGNGNDFLYGQVFDDALSGGAGDDVLLGESGQDRLAAGDGADMVFGGFGQDALGGGLGEDTMFGGDGNDTAGGGFGEDVIDGGTGNDVLSGGAGADWLAGNDGDDRMSGSFGSDYMLGGTGADTMGGGFGNDTMYGYEDDDLIAAGDFDDLIAGNDGNDTLQGGAGADTLYGDAGNDLLNAGVGNSTLEGGEGADVFLFNRFLSAGIHRITDFNPGLDDIRIAGFGTDQVAAYAFLNFGDLPGGARVSVGSIVIIVEGFEASQMTQDVFTFV